MSVPLKRVILILIWLTILVQLSWGQTDCGVSMVFHSPETDSLKIADKWFARDKAEHLVASAFLSGVSCSVFRDFYDNRERSSVYFSAALTFTLGLGKEFYDRETPQGKFSYKDLVADVLGIALGVFIATR
ncbi:MAG: hypothetical protein JSV10_00870 [Candidatus Zixiibacteriota bacterium]|nr:MAG: hypothetical protein JSV10_00870 [candidate division Zixibacteria bacterium]